MPPKEGFVTTEQIAAKHSAWLVRESCYFQRSAHIHSQSTVALHLCMCMRTYTHTYTHTHTEGVAACLSQPHANC